MPPQTLFFPPNSLVLLFSPTFEHCARTARQRMYLLRRSSRRRVTETMRSLSLRASPQSQAQAATTAATASTTTVRMPAPALPRAAFRALDFHASRLETMSRHHPRAFSSHLAVAAAAAADASEAMSTSTSAAASVAAGGNGIDFVGELEEELPKSFNEFDLDDRVTVCRVSNGEIGSEMASKGASSERN